MDPGIFGLLPIAILGAIMFVVGLYFTLKERRESRGHGQSRKD